MKRLFFQEILLLSEKERAARSVKFHSQVTVIKGPNDRGKSCLIKSIYAALGATPEQVHPKWNALKTIVFLRFTVDDQRFSILKMGKRYSLYDAEDVFIESYMSITTELGPKLADMLDFRLQLTNATTLNPEQATPACLFLPFYVDQDKSWTENWESFANLSQFKEYRKAVADFHSGIKPNGYYVAQNVKRDAEERREACRTERGAVKRVLDKIEHLMAASQFDIDVTSYQNEIDRLLIQCNKLRVDEERIRDEMVALDNRKTSVERQIQIAEAACDELGKDFEYASQQLDDDVECPMCGAEYHNSFVERFSIAQDEDRLRTLIAEMHEELLACYLEISKRQQMVHKLSSQFKEISELLETQQGEVKFRDVLQSEGKKEVRDVLRAELDDMNLQIGAIDSEIEDAQEEMKGFKDKKRSTEINTFYRNRMSEYLQNLHVTELPEETYKSVSSKIKETGSDLPRALLAFYFSILHTINKFSTAAFCPIIIDSPKQQDLDQENWVRVLEFIRDNRPHNSQLILGLVEDQDIELGGDVIELSDERQLLQTSEYEKVAAILRPFIDAALAN